MRAQREWHPNFKEYMEKIIRHPNYHGIPESYLPDGKIRWVVTGNSEIGKKRTLWWREKARELNIPIAGKWISKTAKANHPFKEKACQVCGRYMNIKYIYPSKNLAKKLNALPGLKEEFDYFDFKPIDIIIQKIIIELQTDGFKYLKKLFKVPDSIPKTKNDYWHWVYANRVVHEDRIFSPGAMSNAPDRLDGFHTYNLCCRATQDTGRHKENLSRYIEDRRAYEHWSDGDWKAASWLMQKGYGICCICGKEGAVSPDHIGPISLGFAHLPFFQPTCQSCNSAKNNRMFLHDVKKLIELENKGVEVASWHSKCIWNSLKNSVKTEDEAKKLSKFMRIAHHHFLELFYLISYYGYKDFLLPYLNPQYALYEKIEFLDLDLATYKYKSLSKQKGTKTQYHNNAARYIRIAFEGLYEYHEKTNRNITFKIEAHVDEIKSILTELKNDSNYNKELRTLLNEAFDEYDKKVREEIIKEALDKYNERPYHNQKIHNLIESCIQTIAKNLILRW